MIVGFTGTQEGMTYPQKIIVASILTAWRFETEIRVDTRTYHHGCCIGADEEFHNILRILFKERAYIVGHPPTDMTKVAGDAYYNCNELWNPRGYLQRNRDMAIHCDRLIATPKEDHMIERSGTWATIRYYMNENKRIEVVKPDGSLLRFPHPAQ